MRKVTTRLLFFLLLLLIFLPLIYFYKISLRIYSFFCPSSIRLFIRLFEKAFHKKEGKIKRKTCQIMLLITVFNIKKPVILFGPISKCVGICTQNPSSCNLKQSHKEVNKQTSICSTLMTFPNKIDNKLFFFINCRFYPLCFIAGRIPFPTGTPAFLHITHTTLVHPSPVCTNSSNLRKPWSKSAFYGDFFTRNKIFCFS